MITCLAPLTASPDTIRVPGASIFSISAVVMPDEINSDPFEAFADVTYTIEDEVCRVCFSNGRKTVSIRERVTAGGTEVSARLRFICCGEGIEPAIIAVTATVTEEGVPRCGFMRFDLQIDGYDC
jgi:hypothetical protein